MERYIATGHFESLADLCSDISSMSGIGGKAVAQTAENRKTTWPLAGISGRSRLVDWTVRRRT